MNALIFSGLTHSIFSIVVLLIVLIAPEHNLGHGTSLAPDPNLALLFLLIFSPHVGDAQLDPIQEFQPLKTRSWKQ